jgi:hypothetical protein
MIAAAWIGPTTSDSIGVEIMPTPAKPPLARPTRVTAGMATT